MAMTVALLAWAAPAFAIGSPFSVSGKVLDRYGNPVQSANVTLLDFNYKIIKIVQTDDNGNYDFINVISNTDVVTVRINLTKDGKTYSIPSYYMRWYPAKGVQFISPSETIFPGYPQPVYGYVYGAIQTDASNSGRFINGIVYLKSLNDSAIYYEFADRTDGMASFMFYVPPGPYVLYAQHWENGVVYESACKQIIVQPNNDASEVLETRIVLSLDTPDISPDMATMPFHHNNRITGIVTDKDGKPVSGAILTLYQMADNGTGFIPKKGSSGGFITATTDANGSYELYGINPTTDDGKVIQAKKDIKALVEYHLADNLTVTAWSGEKSLYYPDVILGYGAENQARDVALPMAMSLSDKTQPTVSVSELPTAPAPNIAVVPLLAALAIGLLCLIGLYVALNRKGD